MTVTLEQLEAASKDELLIKGFTKLAALGSFSGGADLMNMLMRTERYMGGPSTDMIILERLRELFPQAEGEEINELYVNTLAMSLNEFVVDLPD